VVTLELRSTAKNVVALIGGIFGAVMIVAIIVLAVVVWRLRKKVKREAAAELPNLETLNRNASGNKPYRDFVNTSTYMMPMPNEMAPTSPPYQPLLPPRPYELRSSTSSSRRDPQSHIYAEPHFYHTIGPDNNYEPVNGSTYNYEPVNGSTNNYEPVNGSMSNYDTVDGHYSDIPPDPPSAPPSPSEGNRTDDGQYLAIDGDERRTSQSTA